MQGQDLNTDMSSFPKLGLSGTGSVQGQDINTDMSSFFEDPCLKNLILEAMENNTDIETARLNIEQSNALLHSAKLSVLPSFSLEPSVNGEISKPINDNSQSASSNSGNLSVPVTAQWEFSFGGKRRAERENALATANQSMYLSEYEKTNVAMAVAETYYTLIMLDREIAIVRESIENQARNVEAIKAFKSVGKMNEMAVNQADASLQETKATLLEYENQLTKTENALAILLNRKEGMIERSTWESAQSLSIQVPESVDLALLSERPDVKAAETALAIASGNVKIAKADFYPSLQISASAGWTNALGQSIDPSSILLNLIGSLTQPIFNRGVLKANRKVAESQLEQARIAFEKALLTAGYEVQDALADCNQARQKSLVRDAQVLASQSAYESCMELMNYSQSITYLDVLTAQSSYLSALLQQTTDWMDQQRALISLYRSTH